MLSQLFGISEPVLFGIQLRYNLRPLIIMLFTSGLGAAVLSLLHVQSNSYGPGRPALLPDVHLRALPAAVLLPGVGWALWPCASS